MVKMGIFFKVLLYVGTVLGFVFGFLSYVVAIRPQVKTLTSEYGLGMLDGGLIVFVLVSLPLTYAYLLERKKKKKSKKSQKTI